MPQGQSIGYLCTFLYCVVSGISFVFIVHINKVHNEMLSIILVFSLATILFNLLNCRKIKVVYRKVSNHWALVLKLNLATLFNWLGSFLSLNYLDPATALCINLAMAPITTFLMLTPLKKIYENKSIVYAIFLIIIGMLLIIQQQQHNMNSFSTTLLGVLLSVVGGVAGGFVGLYSEKMNKAAFSISQILAIRFYILIIICGIILMSTAPINVLAEIDWNLYLLSSLLIVILPLIMYQGAIKTLGSMSVSLFIPLAPIFAYFISVWVGNILFNFTMLILLLGVCFCIIWFSLSKKKMIPLIKEEK